MRKGIRKLIMGLLALTLALGVTVSVNSAVSAATAATFILLDKTGAVIGECSGISDVDAETPTFTGANFDSGKSASDVAIILTRDVSSYIVTYVCTGTAAGQAMTDVTLPFPDASQKDSYKGLYGLAIEGIGSDVSGSIRPGFAGATALKTVKIPSTVGKIAGGAFKNCTALTSVTIYTTGNEEIRLNSYGAGIFSGCTSLTSFEVKCPKDVDITFSNKGTFAGSSIETITFASGITSIPDYAMMSATALKNVNYGDSVTKIGASAFKGCTSLQSITLKSSIINIGANAFENCKLLTSITLPDNLNEIGGSAFKGSGLTSVTIPGAVQTIGSNAFATESLTEASFAQSKGSVKRTVIPANAMQGATKLAKVTWADTVTEIASNAFNNTSSLTSVNGLEKIKAFGNTAFKGSALTGTINLDSVESIGNSVFEGCENLSGITFGGSLESIGSTFLKGTAVEQVVLPNSLTKCANTPFSGAESLVSATYLGTSIPENIFSGAKTLKTIKLNEAATEVGKNAFKDCYNYSNNISFGKVTSFGASAFSGCYSLTNPIDISSATSFGQSCFELSVKVVAKDTSTMNAIAKYKEDDVKPIRFTGSFNKKITLIDANAFAGCVNMTFPVIITESDEVTIGNRAFTGTKVTAVEVANIKKVGDYAFSYNPSAAASNLEPDYFAYTPSAITSIKLSGGSKVSIGKYAFYNAENVTEFDISQAGITTIGEFAFYNINQVTKLTLPESVTTLSGGCFGGWSMTELTIPASVKSATAVKNERTSLNHGPFSVCKNLNSIVFADGIKTIPSNLFYHVQNQDSGSDSGNVLNITIPSTVSTVSNSNYPAFGGNVVNTVNLVFNDNSKAQELADTIKAQFVAGNENTQVDVTINSAPQFGWNEENGVKYWYEDGVKQGTEGRGKEIYDSASDAWYFLDAAQGGAKATSKDLYQESLAGDWGDVDNGDGTRSGKWVRYDANGYMIKGWCAGKDDTARTISSPSEAGGEAVYYFDKTYGTMAKGYATIDNIEYYFNTATGILERTLGETPEQGWNNVEGIDVWYEGHIRQGYSVDSSYRGKEIYDPASDGWYWLDNVDGGKKAVSKDVYQESQADDAGNIGKWVRYDSKGIMIKGWSAGYGETARQISSFDEANGEAVYYFDWTYGTMAKGTVTIDGVTYTFAVDTGILLQ
jgi:hypothetical protein